MVISLSMKLSSQDMAVIEQALQTGINQGFDYQAILAYREVLSKMQGYPTQHEGLRVDAAMEQVDLILSQIVQLNPDAMIIYVGLYNPFLDLENANVSSLFVQEWNQGIFRIVNRYPQMILIPTFD